jgi:putative serine protease PepD
MNPDSAGHRFLRRGAPIAAAAVIGAATGAGVYALTSGADHPASSTAAPSVVIPAQPAAKTTTSAPTTLTQLYKDDTPGVVDIVVKSTTAGSSSFGNPNFGSPGGGQQQETEAEGSGFVIDGKGDILTNEHVVDGATSITVHFHDGTTAKGTLVGSDKSTDVAIVKVDVNASELHPLTLGDSSTVQPGQSVVAIGSPFGLPGSMTSGIVSAVNRTITAPNGFSISGAIQTDAAINHGNSGGPLIDVSTNSVIGIDAQIESDSNDNAGVGFAVPIDAAKSAADTLIAGGTVQHSYLGVTVGDATTRSGAQVGCVVTNGPADKAGLKAGDVITAVDGTAVSGADALTASLSSRAPGDKVTLTVVNGGSTKSVGVTLGSRPSTTQNNCSK